jgi:hypothetical protein
MRAKGMGRAKFGEQIFDKRRGPIPISPINLPGKSNEGHEVLLIFNFFKGQFPRSHSIDIR